MIKWASQKSSCFIVISIFFLETDEELIFSFTLAALVGDPSLLIELLDAGVPVDSADKFMALWREAHSNRTDVSPVLLQGGADVDQWSSQFHSTVIHEAARKNNTNVIKLLLKHGASTKLEECNGRTPIYTARECNNNACCNFFFFVCWKDIKSKCFVKLQSLIIYQVDTYSCFKLGSRGWNALFDE